LFSSSSSFLFISWTHSGCDQLVDGHSQKSNYRESPSTRGPELIVFLHVGWEMQETWFERRMSSPLSWLFITWLLSAELLTHSNYSLLYLNFLLFTMIYFKWVEVSMILIVQWTLVIYYTLRFKDMFKFISICKFKFVCVLKILGTLTCVFIVFSTISCIIVYWLFNMLLDLKISI
jgi:hypothetical protein